MTKTKICQSKYKLAAFRALELNCICLRSKCGHTYRVCGSVGDFVSECARNGEVLPCPSCEPDFSWLEFAARQMQLGRGAPGSSETTSWLVCSFCYEAFHPTFYRGWGKWWLNDIKNCLLFADTDLCIRLNEIRTAEDMDRALKNVCEFKQDGGGARLASFKRAALEFLPRAFAAWKRLADAGDDGVPDQ